MMDALFEIVNLWPKTHQVKRVSNDGADDCIGTSRTFTQPLQNQESHPTFSMR
jgi:hypothetical protein